ncbi:uncharacterized protein LOC144173311 [Haemaphysalis longicornis]
MTDEWCVDLSALPRFPSGFAETYYASKTQSQRHQERSYKFATESYVCLPTMKTKRCAGVAGPAVAVRCACYRSRKKNADPYTVNLTFTMACEVELAKCSCPAGASGYCNHLMAVLKTVVALQELGYKEPPDELAPTELPQQWRRPRKRMAPEAVMNVNWRRVGEGCLLTPLQSTAREFMVPALTEEQQRVATIKLAEGLEETNSCWADILAEAASASFVDTQCGRAFDGSAKAVQMPLLPSGFQCLVPWEQPVQAVRCELVPSYVFLPNEPSWCPVEASHMNEVLQDLKLSSEDASMLEMNTRQQARSPTWQAARANRLTASRFSSVLSRKQPWTERGIANIMRPTSFSNHIVRYGTTSEPKAVQRYMALMEHLGRPVTVHTCGLMVRPSCPWLGATPDRVVHDPQENPPFGLVEVKCPWTKKASTLQDALSSKDFCVELLNSTPHLKVSSEYYAQVMGQMFCAGLLWTHFVVYAEAWIIVCKVTFCQNTWDAMKAKLDSFYFTHAVPYLSSLSV